MLRNRGISWDVLPCRENIGIEDLDIGLIEEFIEIRRTRRNIPPPASTDHNWLMKMRLVAQDNGEIKPTNGAVLLFCRNPQEHFPLSSMEMARFQGTAGRDFLDKQSITGPLWKMYDQALMFLRRHISIHATRSESARMEKCDYPGIAFREFAINALCHRSYEQMTGSVRCAIFDDAIQITNPGTLPDGLEISNLGCGVSVVRNPLIARIFNETGLIEAWGTGIQTAQQELAKSNLPAARIELKGFFVQITSQWRWPKTLSDNESTIVMALAEQGTLSADIIASKIKLSDRSARKILSELIRKELVVKFGNTKGSYYRLKHSSLLGNLPSAS
jgi:ATP-dependent DNA helicase RecG